MWFSWGMPAQHVQGPGSNPQYHLHSKPNQPTKTQLKTEPGPQFHKAQLGFSRQTLNTPIAVNQLQAVANALLSPRTEMSSVQQKAEQQRAQGENEQIPGHFRSNHSYKRLLNCNCEGGGFSSSIWSTAFRVWRNMAARTSAAKTNNSIRGSRNIMFLLLSNLG